jgi:hypothetical protein
MNLLAILDSDETLFNCLNWILLRRPRLARLLYPILARGRMITLRALGRPPIDDT